MQIDTYLDHHLDRLALPGLSELADHSLIRLDRHVDSVNPELERVRVPNFS